MTLANPPLQSAMYELADALAVNEFYQHNGWTDGLPIVPPTEERVQECLDAAGLAPGDIIGVESVRQRPITAEKVAINAVMAGCLPTYMPVVVTALRAMCDEDFNLHGSTASTGGSAPFVVVNGPVRTAIGMNATHGVLGTMTSTGPSSAQVTYTPNPNYWGQDSLTFKVYNSWLNSTTVAVSIVVQPTVTSTSGTGGGHFPLPK